MVGQTYMYMRRQSDRKSAATPFWRYGSIKKKIPLTRCAKHTNSFRNDRSDNSEAFP